ncbi:hypothetical protein [Streptomyces griseorubiginosus]|uniref:hypothetical protein n=1 Tax=Streptomyces griseorubiginosus TaxID=67304 RepID=UPI0036E561B8
MSSPWDHHQQPECRMTPQEQARRALLGEETLAAIDARVDAAPEPEPGEWVDQLRRIFTGAAVEFSALRPEWAVA